MPTVTVQQHGNSLGITFPVETRLRMGLEAGQDFTLVELEDGMKLVKPEGRIERQMELARGVLRDQADVLKQLARR